MDVRHHHPLQQCGRLVRPREFSNNCSNAHARHHRDRSLASSDTGDDRHNRHDHDRNNQHRRDIATYDSGGDIFHYDDNYTGNDNTRGNDNAWGHDNDDDVRKHDWWLDEQHQHHCLVDHEPRFEQHQCDKDASICFDDNLCHHTDNYHCSHNGGSDYRSHNGYHSASDDCAGDDCSYDHYHCNHSPRNHCNHNHNHSDHSDHPGIYDG
mmetsp:Transcript_63175/g.137380  ORF Transcript_63175/g.137380 Transcript_63175/m.137380 type:complete len:209 (-) Transcript_63175:831-1457(-)